MKTCPSGQAEPGLGNTPPTSRSGSGEPEVGFQGPASGEAVRYFAENLARGAAREFSTIEDALPWCGLSLKWEHLTPRPGWSLLIGSENGRACAVIAGLLLAILFWMAVVILLTLS